MCIIFVTTIAQDCTALHHLKFLFWHYLYRVYLLNNGRCLRFLNAVLSALMIFHINIQALNYALERAQEFSSGLEEHFKVLWGKLKFVLEPYTSHHSKSMGRHSNCCGCCGFFRDLNIWVLYWCLPNFRIFHLCAIASLILEGKLEMDKETIHMLPKSSISENFCILLWKSSSLKQIWLKFNFNLSSPV